MMTTKARQLGMTGTIFRNAHGLPNPAPALDRRDMATLGLALRENYPQYYAYFSTRSFTYGKQRLANHNRLLGRIKGVDGIKTGYTRASGLQPCLVGLGRQPPHRRRRDGRPDRRSPATTTWPN